MGVWIHQDEKATFCFHHVDHFIHDQAQHLIEFKCRVEDTCYFIEGFQFVALALEVVDTGIEDLTLTFESAGWRRERESGRAREACACTNCSCNENNTRCPTWLSWPN